MALPQHTTAETITQRLQAEGIAAQLTLFPIFCIEKYCTDWTIISGYPKYF
jgi:hypothetical protein